MTDIFDTENPVAIVDRNGTPPAQAIMEQGGALQQTRTSYNTAVSVQKPRSLGEVQRRLIDEANLAGETFYYGWGEGKNRVEGPSVKLATAAARCWGNCAIDLGPVQETRDAWVFTAFFIDLETGFTLPRQFRQAKKWTVYGKFDDMRKDDIRFQIGQSKAVRNVVLNALPASLIDQAMAQAKAGVKAKIEAYIQKNGKAAAVELITKELAKQGVSEERILAKIGRAKPEGVTVDDIALLRGNLAAMQNGEVTAGELFPVGDGKDDDTSPPVPPSGTTVTAKTDPQPSPEKPKEDKPKKRAKKDEPKEDFPRFTFDEALEKITAANRYSELDEMMVYLEKQDHWTEDQRNGALDMCGNKIKMKREEGEKE